jgi:hypothetical protein
LNKSVACALLNQGNYKVNKHQHHLIRNSAKLVTFPGIGNAGHRQSAGEGIKGEWLPYQPKRKYIAGNFLSRQLGINRINKAWLNENRHGNGTYSFIELIACPEINFQKLQNKKFLGRRYVL